MPVPDLSVNPNALPFSDRCNSLPSRLEGQDSEHDEPERLPDATEPCVEPGVRWTLSMDYKKRKTPASYIRVLESDILPISQDARDSEQPTPLDMNIVPHIPHQPQYNQNGEKVHSPTRSPAKSAAELHKRHAQPGKVPQMGTRLPELIRVTNMQKRVQRNAGMCKFCKEEPAIILFSPCNHLACCDECSRSFIVCPFCQVLCDVADERPITTRYEKMIYQCLICRHQPASITFIPCGHLAACIGCIYKTDTCPACDSLPKPGMFTTVQREAAKANFCSICKERHKSVMLFPCKHVACCAPCLCHLTCCPICKKTILDSSNLFSQEAEASSH